MGVWIRESDVSSLWRWALRPGEILLIVLYIQNVTFSAKNSLMLEGHKAGFCREGHTDGVWAWVWGLSVGHSGPLTYRPSCRRRSVAGPGPAR